MGVFDTSSDEDNDDDLPKSSTPLHHNPLEATPPEEDVDPLDAYMKSLEDKEESAPKFNAADGRFDLDEEDDEHGYPVSSETTLPFESDDEPTEVQASLEQIQAKHALESTFRKVSRRENEYPTTLQSLSDTPTTPFHSKFWKGEDTLFGRNWRRDHEVTLRSISNRKKSGVGSASNDSTLPTMDPILSFQQLSTLFGASLLQQIATQNYTLPTLVQSQTLPIALSGRDCLVTAATGQGKTLAYVWPICVHLMHQLPLQRDETGPLALVLVPTRELALQVHKQAKPMLAAAQSVGSPLRCRAVIGGQGKYMLLQELKKTGGIELVIATPGRLLDVLSDTKGLSLKRVTFLVLDEADKMLHMGFEQQVNLILQQIRPDRQTLMLSATMGLRVEKVACEWLRSSHAVRISIGRTGQASQNVEQHIMVLPDESSKEVFLVEMLPTLNQVGRCIVFVSTRIKCERLADLIRDRAPGVPVLTLHGDKHQTDRNTAVRDFSKGSVKILVATDVAARGLDIPNVQTVLSFDPAKDLDSHVHRLGRAGRLSKETNEQTSGCAYTLLVEANADFAHILLGAFEREGKAPSPELVALASKSRRMSRNNVSKSRSFMSKVGLGFVEESSKPLVSFNSASGGARGEMTESYPNSMIGAAPLPKRTRWTNNRFAFNPLACTMTLHSSVIVYMYNVIAGRESIVVKQYEALRQFYLSTNMYSEASSRNHNWSFGDETGESAYCNFTGISCDENGLVTTLELNSTYLSGTLPDVFDDFPSLRRIRLFNNSLQGTVPKSLLRSTTLQLLNLGQNLLSGTFPSMISPTVSRFSVHRNAISGTIPLSLCSMTNLVVLDISHLTRMRGSIPDCFGELAALSVFRLTNIGLTGSVPSELCTERNMNGLVPNIFGCDAIACPSGTFQRAVGRQTKEETPCTLCDVPSNVIGSTTCQWHDWIMPTVSPSTEETFLGSGAPTNLQTTYPSNIYKSPAPSPTIVSPIAPSSLPTYSPAFFTLGPLQSPSPSTVNESLSNGRSLKSGALVAVSLLTFGFVAFISLLFVWRRRYVIPSHKRLTDETSSDLETPSIHESATGGELYFSKDPRTTNVARVESSEFNVADEDSLNVGSCSTTMKAEHAVGLDVLPTLKAVKILSPKPLTPSSCIQDVGSPRDKGQEDYPSTRKVRFSLPQPFSISVPNSTEVYAVGATATNAATNGDNEAWLARVLNPLLNPITSCGVPCRDVTKTDHETASAISLDSGFSSLSALFAVHGTVSRHQIQSEILPKQNNLGIDTVLGIRDRKKLKDDISIISPIDSDVAVVHTDNIFRKHNEALYRADRGMEWNTTSRSDDLMYGDEVGRF